MKKGGAYVGGLIALRDKGFVERCGERPIAVQCFPACAGRDLEALAQELIGCRTGTHDEPSRTSQASPGKCGTG